MANGGETMSIEMMSWDDWYARRNAQRQVIYEERGYLISTRNWDTQYQRYLRTQRTNKVAFARLRHEVEELIYKRTHQRLKVPSTLDMSEGEAKALLAQVWGEDE